MAEIFLQLLVLLLVARLLGEGAHRLGQPAAVGELLAGVVIAALAGLTGDGLPLVGRIVGSEILPRIADAGIFFLVLLSGIEIQPREMVRDARESIVVALGGTVVPFVCGFALAWWVLPDGPTKQAQALLVAVAVSVTAVPAMVRVLMDLDILHERVGRIVVAAAVFDDVLGLFLLAVLVAVMGGGGVPDLGALLWLLAKVAMFFGVTVILGAKVYPRVSRGIKVLQAAALEFSALVGVAMAYGLLAELLDLHWVLGAFVAGLYFEPSRVGRAAWLEMKVVVTAVTSGLMAPIFFATIGLHVDVGAVLAVPGFLILLIAVAFAGKLVGAGLPAFWAGLTKRESLAVGAGMGARGAVELVIIGIALESGLFDRADGANPVSTHLLSCLVIMAVVTTMIAPVIMRAVLGGREGSSGGHGA